MRNGLALVQPLLDAPWLTAVLLLLILLCIYSATVLSVNRVDASRL
jgi:hypothetical protein